MREFNFEEAKNGAVLITKNCKRVTDFKTLNLAYNSTYIFSVTIEGSNSYPFNKLGNFGSSKPDNILMIAEPGDLYHDGEPVFNIVPEEPIYFNPDEKLNQDEPTYEEEKENVLDYMVAKSDLFQQEIKEAEVFYNKERRVFFAAHAPEIPSWFMDDYEYRSEEVFFKWRLYYADKMIELLK